MYLRKEIYYAHYKNETVELILQHFILSFREQFIVQCTYKHVIFAFYHIYHVYGLKYYTILKKNRD